jgi:hypothetical protein
MKRLLLSISVAGIAIMVLVALCLDARRAHRSDHTAFATASGLPLSGLFDGVRPNAALANRMRRGPAQRARSCRKQEGKLERIAAFMGISLTAHAQDPDCVPMDCGDSDC